MKLYRSIDFSRLIFLIDDLHRELFNRSLTEFSKKRPIGNFWLDKSYDNQKYLIIKNVIENGDVFLKKSFDFNSKIGGRFNPSRSFGSLYCSSQPTLSALESLYHIFERSRGIYKQLQNSSDRLANTFNVQLPKVATSLIVSFEMEIDESIPISSTCMKTNDLKRFCNDIGFARYIDGKFDENFIFGNDYEISNIIGCYFHNTTKKTVEYPSARIPIDDPLFRRLSNFSIPENVLEENHISLTGNFKEYICEISLDEAVLGYPVKITTGLPANSITEEIYLQPWPLKKHKNQVKTYTQINEKNPQEREKYSREVRIQKFISNFEI